MLNQFLLLLDVLVDVNNYGPTDIQKNQNKRQWEKVYIVECKCIIPRNFICARLSYVLFKLNSYLLTLSWYHQSSDFTRANNKRATRANTRRFCQSGGTPWWKKFKLLNYVLAWLFPCTFEFYKHGCQLVNMHVFEKLFYNYEIQNLFPVLPSSNKNTSGSLGEREITTMQSLSTACFLKTNQAVTVPFPERVLPQNE